MVQATADGDALDLSYLLAEAHKLAGACGTFGYYELGVAARQIEQLVKDVLDKPTLEQQQVLPLLKQAVTDFQTAVLSAVHEGKTGNIQRTQPNVKPSSIWILLPDESFVTDLITQLVAYGHHVLRLQSYHECFEKLQTQTPAIIFSDVLVAGLDFFNQSALLKRISEQQVRLVMYSVQDDFSLRIKAAQQRAEAFFILPIVIPQVITTLIELIDKETSNVGRVAIVEDDQLLAEHYALVLNSVGIKTHIVQHITNIVSELMQFQPDLLLMDLYMPEYSGPEIAGLLRQYQAFKRLPIVFLSSEMNKTLQIQALSHGGDDFLTKPIDDVLLAQSVKVRLARSLEIKNLIEKDSLTNLIKHSAIKQVADLEFERALRHGTPLSIVMLDIDFFKRVNDNYGHATGDVVITALATLLSKRIRKTDKAGRYGGEEFMLVLPDCTAAQARILVNSILDSFSQLRFNFQDDHFSCTFSAGVASTSDNSFSRSAQLVETADAALYKAKQAGRNQVV
ncbi:diguanylate cyclase [Alishewanella tabrizica]